MLSVFFSSKCSLFHNANLFGSCIIHILYTGCAKIKKKIIPAPKGQYSNLANIQLIARVLTLRDCILKLQPSAVSQAMPTDSRPHSTDDNIITEHTAFLLFHYVLGVFTRGLGILVMTCSLYLSSLLQYTRVTDVMYT